MESECPWSFKNRNVLIDDKLLLYKSITNPTLLSKDNVFFQPKQPPLSLSSPHPRVCRHSIQVDAPCRVHHKPWRVTRRPMSFQWFVPVNGWLVINGWWCSSSSCYFSRVAKDFWRSGSPALNTNWQLTDCFQAEKQAGVLPEHSVVSMYLYLSHVLVYKQVICGWHHFLKHTPTLKLTVIFNSFSYNDIVPVFLNHHKGNDFRREFDLLNYCFQRCPVAVGWLLVALQYAQEHIPLESKALKHHAAKTKKSNI